MTYKSTKQRITDVYHPVARAVKAVAKGVKAIVSDPIGMKRTKKLMDMHDRDMAERKKDQLESSKKQYLKVK